MDSVQLNIVVPKGLREDYKMACDFRRISQRQQIIFLMQDFIDEILKEREQL
jgi:hypothetical protein